MSLEAHLHAMQALLLGPEPSEEALRAVGDPARLRIYRSMVRARIHEVVWNALPRTLALLGEEHGERLFAAYLAAGGPKTRYFWRIPLELWAEAEPGLPSDVPPYVRELGAFESARWRLRHAAFPAPPEPLPFSFEHPVLLEPARTAFTARHRIDVRGEENIEDERLLYLFRNREQRVETLVLNPLARALLDEWEGGELTLKASVERVAAKQGAAITEGFLEKLSALLARFLEAGLVLGSAPDAEGARALRAPSR